MTIRLRCSIILLFLMGVAISSCTLESPAATSSVPGTIEPTETSLSLTPTAFPATVTPGITRTPSPAPKGYAGLPDGEYILVQKGKELFAVSVLDRSTYKIYDQIIYWTHLAQNQKELILEPSGSYTPLMVNLETMVQRELPFLSDCYNIYYLDEDKTYLAVCMTTDDFFELFLWSQDGKQKEQLTNCGTFIGWCGTSFYSPDGKWISYLFGPAGSGENLKSGFYITSSTCVDQNMKCDEMANGPFDVEGNFRWAPNSQYIASSERKGISIFEVKNGEIKKVQEIYTSIIDQADEICWSPDSSTIAYSSGNQVMLVNIAEGRPKLFANFDDGVYVIGWVNIKDGIVSP